MLLADVSIAPPLAEMCLNAMKYVVHFIFLPLHMLLPLTNIEFLMATGVQRILCTNKMQMFSLPPSPPLPCCSVLVARCHCNSNCQHSAYGARLGPFRRKSKWQIWHDITPSPPQLVVEAHCTLGGQPPQAKLDLEKAFLH